MKNSKRKLILVIIAIILIVFAVLMIMLMKNNQIGKIASAEESEKKADITGVSDNRFTYSILENGRASITSYKGTDTDVIIPSTIDGYTVTMLGQQFIESRETNIVNLTIPRTVTDIRIANGASETFKNITVEEGNENYISKDGILFSKDGKELLIYPSKKENTTYTIPNGVETIGEGAFYQAENLTSIVIPNTVTKIRRNAFIRCTNLESITIPNSVTDMNESYIFADCEKLNSVKLPNGITKLGDGMFSRCFKLETVDIPATVKSIGKNCFAHSGLKGELVLPDGLETIESDAFTYLNHEVITINIPNSVTKIEKGEEGTRGYATIKCNSDSYACDFAISNDMYFILSDIEGISIKLNPTKTTYVRYYNDGLNLSGGVLTLTARNRAREIPMTSKAVTTTGFDTNSLGTKTVTIRCSEKTTTLSVEVVDKVLKEISIKTNPTTMKYTTKGKYLDLSGGELTLTFEDGWTDTISMKASGVSASGFSTETLGMQPITISYGGKTTILNIEIVENIIKEIVVFEKPDKMNYVQNVDTLDLTGGTLIVYREDGSNYDVDMTDPGVTTSGFSNSTPGTIPVTISYEGKSTILNVTITLNPQIEKVLTEISVDANPTKTTYKKDIEDLDLLGGIITLKYNDNTTEKIAMTSNGVNVTGFSNTTLGKKQLTVTYKNKTTTFEVEIIGNINYRPTTNGKEIIITGGNPGEAIVVIPEEINGKPVTEIGPGAFKDRDDLISVDIPDTVTKIADDAFDGSDNVTIICNSGSKAEEYAKSKDMNYILKGKTVSSISIKTKPKSTYNKGENLNLAGGRILLTYPDGDTSPISMTFTGVAVTGYNSTQEGKQTLTVTFMEKTTSFEVTVDGTQSVILGDIDGNGVVDPTDLLLMKRHIIAGSKTEWILTGDKFTRGDMNTDNLINPTDLLLLKRKIISR